MLRKKSVIFTLLASFMLITTLYMTEVSVQGQTTINVDGGSYTFQIATDGSADIWLVNDLNSAEYYVVDSDSIITSNTTLSLTVDTDVLLGSVRVNEGNLNLAGTSTLTTTGNANYAFQVISGDITIEAISVTISPTNNSGILADGDVNVVNGATVVVNGFEDGDTRFYGIGARNGNISIKGAGTSVTIVNSGSTGMLATDANSIGSVGNISISDNSSLSVSYSGRRAASHGIQAANNISIADATVTSSNNTNGRGMSATNGYISISNSIVATENNLNTGIYSHSSYVTITSGQTTSLKNGSAGILAAQNLTINGGAVVNSSYNTNYYGICSRRGDIFIDVSNVTAENNGSDGITAQGAILQDSSESLVNGHLTISNSTVQLTDNGNHAMSAADSISISDNAQVNANASLIEVTTYVYTNDLTVDNSTLNSEGGIQVLGGNILASNNASIYATEALYNSGASTDELPAIFAARNITAEANSNILGVANIYGVYAGGSIIAADSSIHGFVRTRGINGMLTAAVYSEGSSINASGASEIWENYYNMPVIFNNVTPEDPYAMGTNIASIANYSWNPDLVVASDGTGLLATAEFSFQPVTGKRDSNEAGEPVVLAGSSVHMITFDGLSSLKTFSVTYMHNLGYGIDYVNEGLEPNSTYTVIGNDIAEFSRVGYSFTNWNDSADGNGTPYNTGDTFTITGDITLYAQWEQDEYTITYDGNGADDGSNIIDSKTYTYGQTATAASDSTFTRTGYNFAGWNTAADGNGIGYEANSVLTVTGSMTLYAQWVEISFPDVTIYYEPNGGQGHYEVILPAGESHTILSAAETGITRTNYTLTGWQDSDGNPYNIGACINPDSNLILHAIWEKNTYTLTLEPGAATGSSEVTAGIYYGTVYTLPNATEIAWKLSGYEFAGWKLELDNNTITYSPGADIVITADTTLYAKWEPIAAYKVTYHCNGGYGLVYDSNEYDYGENATVLAGDLIRTGYTFIGWNTLADGTGDWYYENSSIEITQNVNLYAQWQIKTFTLTYFSNNDTNDYFTENTYDYGSNTTIIENTYSWVGRRFIEWDNHISGNGDSFYPGATLVMVEDENLYAQWEMEDYTVTYNANSGIGTTLDEDTYHYGDYAIAASNGFTKNNAAFTGWNTKADGSGTGYLAEDLVPIDGNITLYAQWKASGSSSGSSSSDATANDTASATSSTGYAPATADTSQLPLLLVLNILAIGSICLSIIIYRKRKTINSL